MAISTRVNVFLERARMLSSSSPKVQNKSKSPTRMQEDRSLRVNSPFQTHTRKGSTGKIAENDPITEMETTLNDFMRSRYNISKTIESHKQIEQRFIRDLKSTLEGEIEKNKYNEHGNGERSYKEKAEKVLMIVKEQALSIDRKMNQLKQENAQLKQMLTEKNLEMVDQKLNEERANVGFFIDEMAKKSARRGFEREEISRIAALADFKMRPKQLEDLITQIIQNNEKEMIGEICRSIVEKQNEFDIHFESLKITIEEKRSYSEFLTQKLKAIKEGKNFVEQKNNRNLNNYLKKESEKSANQSINDDEIFLINAESQISKSKSEGESLNASGILDIVYQEILKDIE
jgi:hypothetical protein